MPRALQIALAVMDSYGAKIVAATSHQARTVPEISWTYGIPIAAAYRRVWTLERLGLIEPAGVRANGRRYRKVVTWASRVQSLQIGLEGDVMNVRVELPDELIEECMDAATVPRGPWTRRKISGRLTQTDR